MSEEFKVSIPMFEDGELERFDNNIHSIVEEYSKMMFKEKDQILTQRIIMKQEEEIERLNNIIDELEEDFERKIQSCTIEAETTTNDFYCRLHIATLKKWLNKIKELKGSDKE